MLKLASPSNTSSSRAEPDFEGLLASAVEAHGHLCPGQVVGVRMGILGLRLLNFSVPCSHGELKRLIVYVEMDRCTADAVSHVTGARLGRRSLKHFDYGIMAATFLDLRTGKAYRLVSTESARDLVSVYAPAAVDKRAGQLEAYRVMPDSVLFRVQAVKVEPDDLDLPGPTRRKFVCPECGQTVRDGREVPSPKGFLCRPCGRGAYFSNPQEIGWRNMGWAPGRPMSQDLTAGK